MHKTPCHVIAGPLGVGKTTSILNYLKHQPPGSRVGVLVNDFGPIGLDRAKLDSEAIATKVVNLHGGCICCTLVASLPEAVCRLTDENNLERLIIEPSGMASPAQAVEALLQPELQDRISLQPTIVMLGADVFDEQMFARMPYYRMLCEVADVLVFNRCDQVTEKKLATIRKWASQLDPPKLRVVTTAYGELPDDLFIDTIHTSKKSGSLQHDHLHQFDSTAHADGVRCDADRLFDQSLMLANLERLRDQGIAGNEVLRFKGAIRTEQGWRSIDLANGGVAIKACADHGENLIEWVTRPARVEPAKMLAEIERPIKSTDSVNTCTNA